MALNNLNLRPASFRGVAFEIDTGGQSGGRRIAQHSYPYRDDPNPEDLGRKPRSFSVTAFVLGDDYESKRDAVLEALEKKGPGEYVNHWGKTRSVVVENFDLSESLKEGGITRFNITFLEAGADLSHTAEPLTSVAVETSALDSVSAALDDFKASFNLNGANNLIAPVTSKVSSLGATLQGFLSGQAFGAGSLASSVSSVGGVFSTAEGLSRGGDFGTGEIISRFRFLRQLGGFKSSPPITSAKLGDDIVSAVQTTMSYANTPADAMAAANTLLNYPTSTGMTAVSEQDAANQAAIDDLVLRAALVSKAQAAAEVEFQSYDEAVAARAEVVRQLDDAALTAPVAVYDPLMALRRAIHADITARAANLVKLRDLTLLVTRPTLAIAYQLYGDASRESDILIRNKIPHPGFVAGGRVLKVPNA